METLLSSELGIPEPQIRAVLALFEEGATIPFIARYRKEKTGGLDEEALRSILERHEALVAMEARREAVLKSIREQEKLTPELEKAIRAAATLQEIEDLYLPYKQKKKTRASVARERGLEGLARFLTENPDYTGDPETEYRKYVDPEKGVNSTADALAGAKDIIAEEMAESAPVRRAVREQLLRHALLVSSEAKRKTPQKGKRDVYQLYREFRKPLAALKSYQVLAVNRGEREGFLTVGLEFDRGRILTRVLQIHFPFKQSRFGRILKEAVEDGFDRLLLPSLEREIRSGLTEKADEHAIEVFADNLRQLLLQPPVSGMTVLGIDPGFVSGCKVAVVDPTGRYLEGTTIYPHPPQKRSREAEEILAGLIGKYGVGLIAIGNGTAGRETELLVAGMIRERGLACRYLITSEAGASVYSASKLAAKEFPDLEAAQRGNISIARRVIDPLAELVKIEPKAIGVGLYQHDVDQKRLAARLDGVVESCVNSVGVALNTASAPLLAHVSGLSARIAGAIVTRREKEGPFTERRELLEVPGMGPKTFEQAAGFLRIRNGKEPIDATAIHPESYGAARKLLGMAGLDAEEVLNTPERLDQFIEKQDMGNLAASLGIGEPTLVDIIADLKKPGRDPRDELPPPLLRSDVLKMEDLAPGMRLTGTVRNVVDFGAFVDIGVKEDGLLHVSRLGRRVAHPMELLHVGDVLEVEILEIDRERGRIGLGLPTPD